MNALDRIARAAELLALAFVKTKVRLPERDKDTVYAAILKIVEEIGTPQDEVPVGDSYAALLDLLRLAEHGCGGGERHAAVEALLRAVPPQVRESYQRVQDIYEETW